MNDGEIIGKVQSSMYTRLINQGVVFPFEVLMDVGVLSKENYEDWRFGRVPFLEAICTVNVRKLSFIMHLMRIYAKKYDLKTFVSFYKQWGQKSQRAMARNRSSNFALASMEIPLLKHGMLQALLIVSE